MTHVTEGSIMNAIELAKAYDPKDFEDRIYAAWKAEGLFQPQVSKGKAAAKPFVVVIPPPNVTGVLHMGHGLNNSLQDIIVRYHRMLGEPSLWVPGTDHAGIATQHVVEKQLKARGIKRRDIGREKFVEETWKVKAEHHAVITRQLEKIGSSCDWSRERFTLDEGLSNAVREVFVTLYERKLIYKGKYLVNWCASCGTALADDEVEHDDEAGAMYHIRYPMADAAGRFIEIATTRPETMLGDTAVACHPDDARYRELVGSMLDLPLANRKIPLIADSYVDRDFGTGLVKITPAHDPNDFEVGNRHNLERINILNPDGTLNEHVPEKYRGLKALDARKLVVEDLKALGLFIAEQPITHSIGHCYRCHTVVEPFLSEQWFVKMKPLAEKALKAWRDGDIRFYPQRWENTYEHWLTNIRDWCISRQLWWGHRIPVWYCDHCGWVMVEREEPTICPKCRSSELRQEEDVLDTWFSSWLWPFSVMGWPKDTADLRKYYPTSALVTGYDIIFFWVARMIMAGMEFTGKAPFRDIYITTLVRDKHGRKMSKSLGNGLDPLEVVDEFGADALKFTLAFLTSQGQDVLIDKDSFRLGSKFANKIWNASRYILMNLEGRELVAEPDLNDTDRWIRHRLAEAAGTVRDAFAAYRFNDAAAAVHEFFWNDFCDWYLEATKLSTRSDDPAEKDRAVTVLLAVLEESLRLLHPFLPFVTEEIYGKLPNAKGWLIVQPYPEADMARIDAGLAGTFDALKQLVTLVRALRAEFGISPETRLRIAVRFDDGFDGSALIRDRAALIALLTGSETVEFIKTKAVGAIALAGRGFETYVFAREAIDVVQLAIRFRKDADKERQFMERLAAKLANPAFAAGAPADVVARERGKLDEARARVAKLEKHLADLA
jgi:valyl-tRNA synthetase